MDPASSFGFMPAYHIRGPVPEIGAGYRRDAQIVGAPAASQHDVILARATGLLRHALNSDENVELQQG
jgi:hypothetical protein